MSGKSVNFDDRKINKSDFYKNKKLFQILHDIDVNKTLVSNKILVSKKEPYGTKNSFKYFIGFNDNEVIRSLCLKLPQMTCYARKFKENTTMSFRVNNNKNNNGNNNNDENNKQLLKNYNKICKKNEKLMRIDFESKPVYGDDDKYIKTKIKKYAGSIITNFHNQKNAKRKSTM